jgi:cytochrome P450
MSLQSNFYRLFDAKSPKGNLPTVFSIRDEATHRALKRPVANAYSMSTMVELEPLTDTCISIFSDKLLGMAARDIDLGEWLHWFSFDVITSITFSNRLGFMEREEDVSGIIDALEGRQFYNSIVGQAPSLHGFLLGNPIVAALANQIPALARLNSARFIVQFAAKQLQRYQSKDKAIPEYRDMLARFKRYSNGEEVMSDGDLLSHSASNIFAGADTTAISLRSMFYYLCKNPRCYLRVVDEIDAMDSAGELSETVTFAESNQMKYLQACMKEAMRLHPAVGMLLERIVPEGGVTISGKYIPQGTIIGANPWVLARDQKVYGEDADAYRPERWLEADEKALKLMERNFLAVSSIFLFRPVGIC